MATRNPVIKYYANEQPHSETWYNAKGQKHRDSDEPAERFWYPSGLIMVERWMKDGVMHRSDRGGDKPAEIYYLPNGNKEYEVWYQHGVKSRKVGPAKIYYYDLSKIDLSALDLPLPRLKELVTKKDIPKAKYWYKPANGGLWLYTTYDLRGLEFEARYFVDSIEVTNYVHSIGDYMKVKACIAKLKKNLGITNSRIHAALQTLIPYDKPYFMSTNETCTGDTKNSLITLDEFTGKDADGIDTGVRIVGIKKKVGVHDHVICFSCDDLKIMNSQTPKLKFRNLPLTDIDYKKLFAFHEANCN
jgi:antitoxin component YwqK of YwqJK toxin-antitoxin module